MATRQSSDFYDQLPYDSSSFSDTHPDDLYAVGRLFGMQPAPAQHCRVLELGCATGGNIVPMAYYLPDSEFVGVELSDYQAGLAQDWIGQLGLANIQIHALDIMQIERQFGVFDYIIAHGVYSWVPPAVQQRILALCQQLLKPQGIAYISYNVRPGWHMRNMTRDILLYATRHEAEPMHKLAVARETLQFLARGMSQIDTEASRWMQQEVDYLLHKAASSYLYHEYLETCNEQVMFSEFVARAGQSHLQYLADSELHTMFPSGLGESVEALFDNIDGLLEQEQYIDFLRLRPFRQSLLCHAAVNISRDIDLGLFDEFLFVADLQTQQNPNLKKKMPQTYRTSGGREFTVTHPLTRAALAMLSERYPNGAEFAELSAHARELVARHGNHALAEEMLVLQEELFGLYLSRALRLSSNRTVIFNQLSERPRASRLALSQYPRGNATGPRHMDLTLDAFATRVLTACDGSNTEAQIVAQLLAEWRSDAALRDLVGCGQNEKRAQERITANCRQLLQRFARHGLLCD